MAKRRTKKLTDQIRQAMDDSGLTRYRISKLTGIGEPQLGRFYHHGGNLSADSLDKLGEALKLKITMERKPNQGK